MQRNKPTKYVFCVITLVALLLVASCVSKDRSAIGQPVGDVYVLPAETEPTGDQHWQTNDIEVIYQVAKVVDSFTVEGQVQVRNAITNTFPAVKYFRFYIHYLDAANKVLGVYRIPLRVGYKMAVPEKLPFSRLPTAPPGTVAFAFGYNATFTSLSWGDESLGDWMVYFSPVSNAK
ncbi:MAG: hypothetical protein MI802_19860 [Desulfobacterales bacterium]|nr:hypothetical protein [Desulfobacterales bacterium]